MRYLVTYITGNGEWCHCHRRTEHQTEEYYDLDNVAASMFEKWKNRRGDLEIDEIHLIDDVDEEIVAAVKNKFRALTEKAKKEENKKKEGEKEKDERILLQRLKEKYKK